MAALKSTFHTADMQDQLKCVYNHLARPLDRQQFLQIRFVSTGVDPGSPSVGFLLVVMKLGGYGCNLLLKKRIEDMIEKEETVVQEVTASLATAKEISPHVAVAAVL